MIDKIVSHAIANGKPASEARAQRSFASLAIGFFLAFI